MRELATKLAASDQVRDCVATQWFRFAAGRTEEDPDGCSLTDAAGRVRARRAAISSSWSSRMTQTDAFWYRAPYTQ